MAKLWKPEGATSSTRLWKPEGATSSTRLWKPETQPQIQQPQQQPQDVASGHIGDLLRGMAETTVQHPWLSKAINAAGGAVQPINEAFHNALSKTPGLNLIPEFGRAATEDIQNLVASAYNLPGALGIGNYEPMQHWDLGNYENKEAALAPVAAFAGHVVPSLVSGVGKGFQAAEKLIPLAKGAGFGSKFANILRGMGIGGAAGYALGESAEGERGLGAALGSLGGGLGGAAPSIKAGYAKYFSKLPSAEEITTNIAEHVPNKLKVNAGNLYEEAFEEAEKTGANQALLKETNVAPLLKRLRLPKEEKRLIKKAYKTKDLRDVHKVDKLLGNRIAELEKKEKTRGFLNERDKTALKVARKTKNHMRSGLEKAFESASPEAKKSFKQANDTWKQYLDYKQNPIIKKYLKKSPTGKPGLTAEDFIKKASRNETFKSILAERHPEIEARMSRNKMKGALGKLAGTAIGGAALGEGAHLLWK